jgi:YidC/Oxa1 family membrane protein insertase
MAFVIILGTMLIFTSPQYQKFYTEKILKKEYKPAEKKIQKEVTKESKVEYDKKEKEKEDVIVSNDTIGDSSNTVREEYDTVWMENKKIRVGISEEGAIITNIIMKEYKETGKNNERKIELIPSGDGGGSQLIIGNTRYDKKKFNYTGIGKNVFADKERKQISFEYDNEKGEKVVKSYSIDTDGYKIVVKIEKNQLSGERIGFGWFCGIKESEKQQQRNMYNKKTVHYYNNESVEHLVLKKIAKEEPSGRYKWLGITSKYFFIAINQEKNDDADLKIESFVENRDKKNKQYNYKLEMSKIADNNVETFFIYAGPTKRDELKKFNLKYEKIMFPVLGYGKIFFWSEKWFPWLAEMVLTLLIGIQKIFKDWGVSILILTIITKIITFPMTMSSMKSMEKMKNIQPKVNKIRTKHKNNPQKMNEEIMALYKKEGVNPLNPGCLPMFLQMPVFISLFVVLRKSIEIRGATTSLIPWISDLSQAEVLFSLDKILPNGIPMYGSNVALLPIINAVLTFFSQKMTIKDPNQKAMIYFMPLFMLVIFNSFSSGLVLYWTFQSALQLLQQLLINKKNKE